VRQVDKYKLASSKDVKYIVVCGSVVSGIGKGIISSSIGFILKKAGFNVSVIKIDPYLVNGKSSSY